MDHGFLSETSLFQGIDPEDIRGLLSCLGAYEKHFPKGAAIWHSGETTPCMGLVLEGSVHIVVNSYWGTKSIFGHVEKGQIFGETYGALPEQGLLCDVVAVRDCQVLFLHVDRLLTCCGNTCSFHNRLIHNLLRILASKSLQLSSRMTHIAPRTIRQRVLSYLSEQQASKGSPSFSIPFSRQQLADYLSVDRAALSNELSKMQADGLLTFHKNKFVLHFDSML